MISARSAMTVSGATPLPYCQIGALLLVVAVIGFFLYTPTAYTADPAMQVKTFSVRPAQWYGTGMYLKKGDSVDIKVTGRLKWPEAKDDFGPQGYRTSGMWIGYVAAARVGNSEPVEVGVSGTVTANVDGELQLAIPRCTGRCDLPSGFGDQDGRIEGSMTFTVAPAHGGQCQLSARLLCPQPLVLTPGAVSESCIICISCWRRNTSDPVQVVFPAQADWWGNHALGIQVFAGGNDVKGMIGPMSVDPANMSGYRCPDSGGSFAAGEYPWGFLVSAARTAPPVASAIPIIVRQKMEYGSPAYNEVPITLGVSVGGGGIKTGGNVNGPWLQGNSTVQLSQQGNRVSWSYRGEYPHQGMTGTVSGTFDGKNFSGAYENREGNLSSRGTLNLTLNGNRLEGHYQSTTNQAGPWVMTRATGGNPGGSCFAKYPGAGLTDRNGHYNWAQHYPGQIKANLTEKTQILFGCRSMQPDQLASVFAGVSVLVAQYVPNANCFGGDAGVISTNWSSHKDWASRQQNSDAVLRNLLWKAGSALACMDSTRQAAFFADVSVALAQADAAAR